MASRFCQRPPSEQLCGGAAVNHPGAGCPWDSTIKNGNAQANLRWIRNNGRTVVLGLKEGRYLPTRWKGLLEPPFRGRGAGAGGDTPMPPPKMCDRI